MLLVSHRVVLLVALFMFVAACSTDDIPSKSCTEGDRVLNVGFYAFFEPVSHNADPDPSSEGFDTPIWDTRPTCSPPLKRWKERACPSPGAASPCGTTSGCCL